MTEWLLLYVIMSSTNGDLKQHSIDSISGFSSKSACEAGAKVIGAEAKELSSRIVSNGKSIFGSNISGKFEYKCLEITKTSTSFND